MRPIPIKLRTQIAQDIFMQKCIYNNCDCEGRIEWEHAFLYAGKQINESWNILPVCIFHHRGNGLNKEYNQFRAIIRADIIDLEARMPKKNWRQVYNYLTKKYDKNRKNNK